MEVAENSERRREDIIDLHTSAGDISLDGTGESSIPETRLHSPSLLADAQQSEPENPDFDTTVHTPEVFLFDYGTVVIWGMTLAQEQRFLKEIAKFEEEKLGKEDVQTEQFNFYYTREYQARIYNDFISLREKRNYMTKLAISHALAQSVKTSLYEDLVSTTISTTSPIPQQIALTGKVNLTRRQINMQIGELFILRINIHLQGSVLDAPELMWAEPQLDPVYQAVGLLTERLDVIADLLAVLKDQLAHTHGEYLEWIVIVLIAAEILVAAVNIVVDLYAGFTYEEIEFFLPQLCHLLISVDNESMALEEFILDLCEESVNGALLTFWLFQTYLHDLSGNPQLHSFRTCRRIYNKVQRIVFGGSEPVRKEKIRENVLPVTVLSSLVLASIAAPFLPRHAGPLAIAQARKPRPAEETISEPEIKTTARSIGHRREEGFEDAKITYGELERGSFTTSNSGQTTEDW
ncbi:hypothetical protein B0A49_05912 [Cryomyces minteri]|uniref:DUF155 domain-containing protein n=2 Tax=Cryomyces TaxID=329878 RepID=A0A4U0WUR5_9PEZI|nr:hypothetical protein B0A49_05912 [Cryomyces minteri]